MAKKKEQVFYSPAEIAAARALNICIADDDTDMKKLETRSKVMRVLWLILVYAFLVFMAIIVLIPFYWMLITSLKTVDEIRASKVTYFPQTILWANYKVLFVGADYGEYWLGGAISNVNKTYTVGAFDFGIYLRNTLIVGIISTAGTIVTSILAAFALARLNFKGRDFVFTLLLGTMMIPGEMMVITNYITVANFGWLNSDVGVFAAMIVPFIVSVFYIYLLRQNFKQIPNELYYAAKVDGKSDWQYLWKVMVPLASPTLITIFILKLMGSWNSYVWPNLVATKENLRLMTNGLRAYNPSPDGLPNQGLQMAATVVVTVPLLLLFIFFRKYIMRGVGRAGIKG